MLLPPLSLLRAFSSQASRHITHSMPEAIANGSNGTLIDDDDIDFSDIEAK